MNDEDKAIALQTVFLQDVHEDADRTDALTLEWLATECNITLECEEAWYEYVSSYYEHRTYEEEL
jgi:hypothetical protein